jgi:hypothetical protein
MFFLTFLDDSDSSDNDVSGKTPIDESDNEL